MTFFFTILFSTLTLINSFSELDRIPKKTCLTTQHDFPTVEVFIKSQNSKIENMVICDRLNNSIEYVHNNIFNKNPNTSLVETYYLYPKNFKEPMMPHYFIIYDKKEQTNKLVFVSPEKVNILHFDASFLILQLDTGTLYVIDIEKKKYYKIGSSASLSDGRMVCEKSLNGCGYFFEDGYDSEKFSNYDYDCPTPDNSSHKCTPEELIDRNSMYLRPLTLKEKNGNWSYGYDKKMKKITFTDKRNIWLSFSDIIETAKTNRLHFHLKKESFRATSNMTFEVVKNKK